MIAVRRSDDELPECLQEVEELLLARPAVRPSVGFRARTLRHTLVRPLESPAASSRREAVLAVAAVASALLVALAVCGSRLVVVDATRPYPPGTLIALRQQLLERIDDRGSASSDAGSQAITLAAAWNSSDTVAAEGGALGPPAFIGDPGDGADVQWALHLLAERRALLAAHRQSRGAVRQPHLAGGDPPHGRPSTAARFWAVWPRGTAADDPAVNHDLRPLNARKLREMRL
ncbi:MAG: hypothetical protein DWH79_12405 [Planctomycetota bacterium]|nr:MAG: hypothetical protein DWH79_12405 [Planctomycetota bacterium]